ncbi:MULTISPECIES: cytochrome b/b6 domain-containing protein [unclassified Arsukibacterium]|uniref:cytochrome b/b6 domain-containing protein n=1 Tax=unclassified Arsukibacterium TaxID=2635278 RepID=UPI000C4699B4|nr:MULTISPECIES: cytochrome b/b6 domain-containing protein [unclassified Arsukibacterium]MAA93762.1 cytochrome B [Rheinheimera sp.]MBM35247.1 cytochrome B [Rheinheimera sp.]HAW94021.1 cytochrome B [Candidatus Azambacteria bacterium]|tara:strand:- start:82 stop:732 length:651 start_codon:yes stop_codon:yes gene_type:complete
MAQKIKVWDSAVRFFHWTMVLLVAGLWYSGSEGYIALHQLFAYGLASLLIARIGWGIWGSETARFRRFVATPGAAINYLRHTKPVVGHNPASSYMIFTLLALLALQIISGLATFDNSYMSDGPLVAILPASWVDVASAVHKFNINIILVLVAVHVFFALWHSWRHDNVIKTLFTGNTSGDDACQPTLRHSWSFFVLLLVLLWLLYYWQGRALLALL